MPRAPAQSSLDQKKPAGDRCINTDMQATAIPPAAKNGLAAMHSTREFDLWLQRELCRLHGDVLHEPIPQKLLQALQEAAEPRD